jgi:hypothetical protein
LNDLSFLGWFKISGATFAVMVFGFGLLWQAQQVNTAQIMELGRSTNAQIAATNEQIAELSRSTSAQFAELNRTVGRPEEAIGRRRGGRSRSAGRRGRVGRWRWRSSSRWISSCAAGAGAGRGEAGMSGLGGRPRRERWVTAFFLQNHVLP